MIHVRRLAVRTLLACALILATVAAMPGQAAAATVPSGFSHTTYASGLSRVTAMAFAPDGRLFVTEQAGTVRVIKNGVVNPTPFVTLTVDHRGERGLTGIAFDPAFATNRYVYLYYTASTPASHNRVSRFVANGDVAQTVNGVVTETPLIDLDNLSTAWLHNGGALNFGNDGRIYVAVGDNGAGANAQSLSTAKGKLLRIGSDGSIPSDNPFVAQTTGVNRAIWALGLRNPYTTAVQPGTGRMFVNDVGQDTWEEINEGSRAANYGWPVTEGPTSDTRYRSPFYAYQHNTGTVTGCAVTGGAFYNPPAATFPAEYVGDYFFADFCGNWIKRLDPATGVVTNFVAETNSEPIDLRVGPDGALYYLARNTGGTGNIGRIAYTNTQAPQITEQPANQTVSVGAPATFTVDAAGTQPISYRWQRNGVNISGATSRTYTLASADTSDSGARFRAIATNTVGSTTSAEATLTVTTNQPPTSSITAPASGTTYAGGDTILYAGTASDPETGALSGSAFTWWIDFHHDTHAHPFLSPVTGSTEGSFTAPASGHVESNVWYRIHLRVTDPAGLTSESTRDVMPRKSTISLQTNPTGLQVNLDDQPRVSLYSTEGVAGVVRKLEAPATQVVNGVSYAFTSWSDGGARVHNITTPEQNTTYTASYGPASTTTITPTADSLAQENLATTNFGTTASMASRGPSPTQISYLRYNFPAAPAGYALSSATFGFRTTDIASAGSTQAVSIRTAGDTWTETGLTWNNRPSVGSTTVGSIPAGTVVSRAYVVPLDATVVRGLLGATSTVALTHSGDDSFWLWSRQHANPSYRPAITLTFSPATAGDTTSPSMPGGLNATVSGSSVSLAWTASTDNVAVTGYDVHRSDTSGFTPSSETLVGSATGTTFTHAGVGAGTWYYRVVAKDGAGNRSTPSAQASAVVTSTTTPTTVSRTPTADTYANEGAASTVYGATSSLASRGSLGYVSYLRFVVPAAPSGKTLTGAVLRIRTSSETFAGSASGHSVQFASDSWSETTLTWSNRPARSGSSLGTIAAGAPNTFYDTVLNASALQSLVGAQGTLAITGVDSDNLWFWSRTHATTTYRPLLILTYS